MTTHERACCYCGTTEQELRPYAPGGRLVCFDCAMKPERKGTTEAEFKARLDAIDGPVVLTPDGPKAAS